METAKYVVAIVIVIVVIATLAIVAWLWGGNVSLLTGETFEAPTVTQINPSTVSLALGDVLLFETPAGDRGGIRFDRMTHDAGVDYTSWFIPAGSTMPLGQAKPTPGHVFEMYWRSPRGWHEQEVQDMGGNDRVQCGPVTIEWSGSTWLYIPPSYRFAIHEKNAGSGPDFESEELAWHVSPGEAGRQPPAPSNIPIPAQ